MNQTNLSQLKSSLLAEFEEKWRLLYTVKGNIHLVHTRNFGGNGMQFIRDFFSSALDIVAEKIEEEK